MSGGASGLGRATVERFTKQGARVVLCDLPSSDGEKVAKQMENCMFLPADVSNFEFICDGRCCNTDTCNIFDLMWNSLFVIYSGTAYYYRYMNKWMIDRYTCICTSHSNWFNWFFLNLWKNGSKINNKVIVILLNVSFFLVQKFCSNMLLNYFLMSLEQYM